MPPDPLDQSPSAAAYVAAYTAVAVSLITAIASSSIAILTTWRALRAWRRGGD